MGLSMTGFEGDFLKLMYKVSKRRNKEKESGGTISTKYEREMKKFEWAIKDGGSIKSGAQGRGVRGTNMFLSLELELYPGM